MAATSHAAEASGNSERKLLPAGFHGRRGEIDKKQTATSDAKNPAGDESERDDVKTVCIPPGKMGLTLDFFAGGSGAVIEAILPHCAFKDEVRIGDRIATVDGKNVVASDDLRLGNDRARYLGIVPSATPAFARVAMTSNINGFLRSRGCLPRSQTPPDEKDDESLSESEKATPAAGKRKRSDSEINDGVNLQSAPPLRAISCAERNGLDIKVSVQVSRKPGKMGEELGGSIDKTDPLIKMLQPNVQQKISAEMFIKAEQKKRAEERRERARQLKGVAPPQKVISDARAETRAILGPRERAVKRKLEEQKEKEKNQAQLVESEKLRAKVPKKAERTRIAEECRKNEQEKQKEEHRTKAAQEKRQLDKLEFERWLRNWNSYQKIELAKHIRNFHGTDGWEYRCRQLRRYKQDHDGDCSAIPLGYKAPDDLTLGQWADEQRNLYRDNELAPERIVYLESQGFDFDHVPAPVGIFTGEGQFDEKVQELIEYRQSHDGDADVPLTYPDGENLGLWVRRQRKLYEEGTLDEDQHAILEEKGFLFEPGMNVMKTIIDKFWKNGYKELEQFKMDHGHLDVPNDYKANVLSIWLDKWICNQRLLFKRRELSLHRVRMLEDLGLKLNVSKKRERDHRDVKWDKMYNDLISYQDEHGNTRVPTDNKGQFSQLGQWVRRQRKWFKTGKMEAKRLERLQAIGFEFDPMNRSEEAVEVVGLSSCNKHNESNDTTFKTRPDESVFKSQVWTNNYEALESFAEINGNTNVPILHKDNSIEGSLHTWLETQKRFFEQGCLPSPQVEMLESLGVDLSEKYSSKVTKYDITWMLTFSFLEQYYKDNGHTNVPDDYVSPDAEQHQDSIYQLGGDRGLGKWLSRQREYYKKKTLAEDRVKKLESLGFSFTFGQGRRGRPRGVRDKKSGTRSRNCMRCKTWAGGKNTRFSSTCPGRTGTGTCSFFDENGAPIACKLCAKFGGKNKDVCRAHEDKQRLCQYFEKDGAPKMRHEHPDEYHSGADNASLTPAAPAVAVPIPKPGPLPVRHPYTMTTPGHMIMGGNAMPPKGGKLIPQPGTGPAPMLQGFLRAYAPPHTPTGALPKNETAGGLLPAGGAVLGQKIVGNLPQSQAVGVHGAVPNVWKFPQLIPRNPLALYPFPLYLPNSMFLPMKLPMANLAASGGGVFAAARHTTVVPNNDRGKNKQRRDRHCLRCREGNNTRFSAICSGRGGRAKCAFFDATGTPILCKLCIKYDGNKKGCKAWGSKGRRCQYFELENDDKRRHCSRCHQGKNERFRALCPGRDGRDLCAFFDVNGAPILCKLCVQYKDSHKNECKAWENSQRQCQFFEKDGTPNSRIIGQKGHPKSDTISGAFACGRCNYFGGDNKYKCGERKKSKDDCDYFDLKGARRCRRCAAFGKGLHKYECAATKGHVNECEYFSEDGKQRMKEQHNIIKK